MALPLRVKSVSQAASGGSHVTRYDATLTLTPTRGVLVALGKDAVVLDPDEEMLRLALGAIQRGALEALDGAGLGAVIEVVKLVLHPVDFKPHMYEELTRREVAALVAHPSGSPR